MEVEAAEGLAIMMAHYTPVNCQHQFGVRYRTLMERFQNVVRFGIAGHTHNESYQLSNSMTNPEKPVVMTTVGGSVTTYDYQNPSFKVIDIDAGMMLPTNMHTYYIDVDETNERGAPEWRELHDHIKDYQMSDLSPSSFRDLALRIFGNKDLANYFRANEQRTTVEKLHPNHYKTDQLSIYCDIATSEMHEHNECMHTGSMSAYGRDFKLLSGKILQSLVDDIIGNWIDVSLSATQ